MDRTRAARAPRARLKRAPPVMEATTPGTGDARRTVVGASIFFALLLVAAGWWLLWVRGAHPVAPLRAPGMWRHAGLGAAVGALSALVFVMALRSLPVLARTRRMARHAVDGIEPRWHTVLSVALAAGVGEEFFFRGALEPWAGRWLTAAAFVALHGALRIRNRGGLALAVFLFGASLGLSALNAWLGLVCAMAAHAAYDFTMMHWLVRDAAGAAAGAEMR